MRRLLSFILALAVFCSCMPAAAETPDTADAGSFEPIDNEAFEALKGMGLLTDDFLNIDAGSAVTRAQFLGALYRLTGLTQGEADISLPFSDVNSNTPHRDAIAYFHTIGAVNGAGSSTFEPDGEITYIQAVKIIADFLGYKTYVQQCLGEYPAGYLTMSIKLDLSHGITLADNNAPISAEAAVRLIYNAANTPIVEAVTYNDKGEVTSYSASKDRTPLTAYNNILYDEAVLQDNGIVSLSGEASSADTVVIGGKKYKSGDLDLTDYLGMELQFFYKSGDETDTVLWACANSYNEILDINSKDLITDDPAYGISKIVYWKNERRKTVDIDEFADIVYNNALSNNVSAEYLKPQAGGLKLIDNDSDGDFDIVIVKDYRNIFVNAVSSEKEFISNQYGDTLDLSVYSNIKIFNEDGRAVGMNEISSNRVISYLANPDSTEYIYIYVNDPGKTAMLEAVSENDSESIYTFKDEELKLAKSLSDAISSGMYYIPQLTAGQTYTYFLDIEGNIAAVKLGSETERYAFFIAAMPNDESFAREDSYKVKMLLPDGITTVVTTSDKFKKTGYDDGIPLDEKEAQAVMVSFDGEGCLKEMKFAAPLDSSVYTYGFNKNEFTMDYAPTRAYYRNKVFNGSYTIDGRTLIFATMISDDGERTYEVLGSGSIFDEKTYSMVRLYDADEYMHANVLTITLQLGHYVNNQTNLLLDEVRNCINENGDECVKLIGIMQGKEREILVENKAILPEGLKRGDLVQFALINNKVHRVVKVYSLSDPNLAPLDTTEAAGSASGYSVACGYLYSNDGVNINLYNPDGWNNGNTVLVSPTRSNQNMLISVYDARTDRIYVGTANQLYQNCSPQADGTLNVNEYSTKIFINRRYGYITDLVAVYY
ncbi:MAG: S-layer homology domain-containing protein [Clostridia bacterium]|nr:S-layer homology domain-containing protein [Clostridia bacterium]